MELDSSFYIAHLPVAISFTFVAIISILNKIKKSYTKTSEYEIFFIKHKLLQIVDFVPVILVFFIVIYMIIYQPSTAIIFLIGLILYVNTVLDDIEYKIKIYPSFIKINEKELDSKHIDKIEVLDKQIKIKAKDNLNLDIDFIQGMTDELKNQLMSSMTDFAKRNSIKFVNN